MKNFSPGSPWDHGSNACFPSSRRAFPSKEKYQWGELSDGIVLLRKELWKGLLKITSRIQPLSLLEKRQVSYSSISWSKLFSYTLYYYCFIQITVYRTSVLIKKKWMTESKGRKNSKENAHQLTLATQFPSPNPKPAVIPLACARKHQNLPARLSSEHTNPSRDDLLDWLLKQSWKASY